MAERGETVSDVTVLHVTKPKARKPHQCDECGRTIEKGETYLRQDNVFEGQRYSWIVCAQCRLVGNILVEMEGHDAYDFILQEWLADEFPAVHELFRAKWLRDGALIPDDEIRPMFAAGWVAAQNHEGAALIENGDTK